MSDFFLRDFAVVGSCCVLAKDDRAKKANPPNPPFCRPRIYPEAHRGLRGQSSQLDAACGKSRLCLSQRTYNELATHEQRYCDRHRAPPRRQYHGYDTRKDRELNKSSWREITNIQYLLFGRRATVAQRPLRL